MKLLYFSRDYTVHDHRFLSALAQTDISVSFLRLERRGAAQDDRPLPPGIEQIAWAGGQRPARWQDGFRLLPDLKRVIRRVQPDVILAGPLQRSAFLAALSGFRPLVSMSWGYDLIFDARRGPLWAWATRYTLRRSAALVGDCATIRRMAMDYGMHPEHIVTFPWGIDLEHFSPAGRRQPGAPHHESAGAPSAPPPTGEGGGAAAGVRGGRIPPASPIGDGPPALTPAPLPSGEGNDLAPFTLLSVRGWEPIYGVDVLARAFVIAARRRPELRLVMLGGGSQAGLLRQIFERGGVEAQVFFPGSVRQDELPRYYRNADLYLSASHSDGTSISLLEALACGCPALVSDIPGNREWIEPGVQGWWFPDGDENALAQGILHAVEQRAALPEMGRAARSLAEARADWNQNFKQLHKAFEIALHHER